MAKILVVDDEPEITDSCVMYLEMEGYDACGAKNSKEAFAALEKYKPEVLILDLNLNESVSGLHILKKALEYCPSAQAAVLTGHSEGKVAEKCYAAGAKMIVEKPIAIEKFKEIVDKLSNGLS